MKKEIIFIIVFLIGYFNLDAVNSANVNGVYRCNGKQVNYCNYYCRRKRLYYKGCKVVDGVVKCLCGKVLTK